MNPPYPSDSEHVLLTKMAQLFGVLATGVEFDQVLLCQIARRLGLDIDGAESPQMLLAAIYNALEGYQTPSVASFARSESGFYYGIAKVLRVEGVAPFDQPALVQIVSALTGVLTGGESPTELRTKLQTFIGGNTPPPQPSNNTNLSVFTVNGSPVVNGDTVSLVNGTASVTVIATPQDPSAVAVVSGDSGLTTGDNALLVHVTAADGVTTRDYTVTLRVASAFNLSDYGTVVFRSNGVDYNASTGTCADGSGNGHDAVQATAGARPALTTPVSAPAMTFDGANDNLQSPFAATLGDLTAFVVFGWNAGNPAVARVLDKTFTTGFLMGCSLSDNTLWGGGVRFSSNPYGTFIPSTPGRHIMFLRRSGSAITVGLDGNRSRYTGDATALSNSALGIGGEAGAPSQYFYGYLEDAFIYDSALTDDQAAAIIAHYGAGAELTFGVAPVSYTFHGGSLGSSFADGKFEILLPNSPVAGQWVIYCHGVGEAEAGPRTEVLKAGVVEAILAAGYGIASSIAHGQNFGNPDSVADYEALCAYLVSNFGATKIVVFSQSMGGLAGLNLVSNGNVSQIAGWFGIYPAADLAWMHDNGFSAGVEAAFPGYPTGADASNPILRSATTFATRMRFYASPGDGTVTKADNSDAMAAHVAGHAIESTVVVCSGGHGDASHFQPSDVLSFLGRCFTDAPIVNSVTLNNTTPTVGDTITAAPDGTNCDTFTYVWKADGVVIVGEAGSDYTATRADAMGHAITCELIGHNASGDSSPLASSATAAVTGAPLNTVAPVVTTDGANAPDGPATVGNTLSSTDGTWTGYPVPTITYQFLGGGYPTSPSSSNTYVTGVNDVGDSPFCRVTGTNTVSAIYADSNTISVS